MFQQNGSDQRNLGVGAYNIPGRAYERTATESTLRLAESGSWGRTSFGEMRMPVRWSETTIARRQSNGPTRSGWTPSRSGGAAAGRRLVAASELEWEIEIDIARGRYGDEARRARRGKGRRRAKTWTNDLGNVEPPRARSDDDAGNRRQALLRRERRPRVQEPAPAGWPPFQETIGVRVVSSR